MNNISWLGLDNKDLGSDIFQEKTVTQDLSFSVHYKKIT